MDTIRILLSDEKSLMRDGLEIIINAEEDMCVIGAAASGIEAYNMIEHHCPHLIIMDIQKSETEELNAIKMIKKDYPDIFVIVLTDLDNEDCITRALSYGANSYLLKSITREKLVQTIRETMEGNLVMPSVIASKLAARLKKLYEDSKRYENMRALGFSEREREIADLLIKGFSNKQIASKLYITEGTAKNYVSTIYNKVGVNDRTRAVIFLKEYIAC